MQLNEKEKLGWLRELLELGFGKQLVHLSIKMNSYHPMLRAESNVDVWTTIEMPADDFTIDDKISELYEVFGNTLKAVSTETSYIDGIRLVKIHFMGIGGLDNMLKDIYKALKVRFDERFNSDLEALLQE